jgi:hypothetical protein
LWQVAIIVGIVNSKPVDIQSAAIDLALLGRTVLEIYLLRVLVFERDNGGVPGTD